MCLVSGSSMLGNYVSCTYVATSVTLYRSALVDLSRSRSVHALEHEPCCPDPVRLSGTTCNAVHYGLCSPLLKLPPFSIPPPTKQPSSTSPVKQPSSPVITPTSPLAPPVLTNSTVNNNLPNAQPDRPTKKPVEVFDPFELLSSDLEGKLEALVTSFVAQDKVRLAARHKPLVIKADGVQFGGTPSPLGDGPSLRVTDRYIKREEPELKSREGSPKASPEYRESGVKVQISKFGSVHKDTPRKPSLENESPSPSPTSQPSPEVEETWEKKPSEYLNVASAVDYAKSRLQQQRDRDEAERTVPKLRNGHPLDNEAKMPWEPQPETPPLRRSPEREGSITPTIPHPKLTTAQKQHIRERSLSPTQSSVPVRPFLTKGSVAERVLLFERCPSAGPGTVASITGAKGKASVLYSSWRAPVGGADAPAIVRKLHKDKENVEPSSSETGSLRRLPKSATRATHNLPRFYYPSGKPLDTNCLEDHLQKVAAFFAGLQPNGKATIDKFGLLTKVCGIPLYWKCPLFQSAGGEKKGFLTSASFLEYWRRVVSTCHDEASRFVRILSRGLRNYLIPDDFTHMIQDIIETHPGLLFLKEAPEFHSRYVHTVIARIFYCVNRSWTGKLTIPELRKSNFLRVVRILEEEEDINQITEYFSYEHFYVIYCKFWELDKDHDLYIDKNDLARHNDGALSSRIIDRIFSGAVTRGTTQKKGKLSYSEFVWFLLSEEDKRHPRSIEYWFRCMDLDGDGFLSMYELEYFYEEQLQRMEALGIETLPYKDCLCQMLDMIRPVIPGQVSLADLKRCKMTPIFFDTFFNLEKYLDHEQRDPFASQRDHEDCMEISDWDRYAAEEYELLVAEENANEQAEDLMYEDFDDNELSAHLEKMAALTGGRLGCLRGPGGPNMDDDDYDYADSDAEYHY